MRLPLAADPGVELGPCAHWDRGNLGHQHHHRSRSGSQVMRWPRCGRICACRSYATTAGCIGSTPAHRRKGFVGFTQTKASWCFISMSAVAS